MHHFLSAVQGVLVIFIVLGIGFYLAKIGWFDDGTAKLFLKLILNVTMPMDILVNLSLSFSKSQFLSSLKGELIPFLSILSSYFIAYVLSRIIKIERKRRGVFMATFSFSNAIFIGLPLCRVLFGDVSTPYSLMYYMANTVLWWTIGVYCIAIDSETDFKKTGFWKGALKRIMSPPLVALFVGITLILLNVKLPDFLMKSMELIGDITTPLSLFYVGIVIYNMEKEKLRFSKETVLVLLGRFLIAPALIYLMALFIDVPRIMRDVFIVMSGMPVMVNSSIVSRVYGADYEFATSMITYSTIFSIIVIPALMVLINRI